ncbi:MAG: hypothetical protein UR28_C0034G0003 [Candidatus Peregrinibacteria bacterium GW2011_GWF2_33_10]|nr:MAG: hypothetical protein UR28_C0034G0003 [Candidatus Peregrinibacteria bacterium GW2011_GWF2_33_10]OGJ44754.1 MAG: nucleoid-associated protein, YbaB/EbfC family [Candidatus Peregrinibacteria bacterium RIFOXYA2_FULL_33_21]OGJ46556.1 MAG: nucleoid-associated protein, YbaB/EbfC family [Candidatus Peregrinibacteria bacterium RIFOXYA12_FULL_33_12]OGJ51446.1 MAG: nucleoid-associated protein, YbaB/EbfC family [Candidatus Peregrinibacteria bacterium RIFOXYB2_FULL_33_20]
MGVFDKAKDMYKLQKQAKEIKKKLENIHIESAEEGVTITIDGHQTVISVKIEPSAMEKMEILPETLKKAFNKAIKKSQEIAAAEMKSVMGDMGLGM